MFICIGEKQHKEDKESGNTLADRRRHRFVAGFDSLPGDQTAKNTLVVGAIDDITDDPYGLGNVNMTSFSSYGPTDDGRMGVDVVANGIDLLSTYSLSDTSYAIGSGTSMSSPNVAGTAILLVEHYEDLFGALPRSATTKGVLTHNAFDAGNPGPDYSYGWGVVDAAASADFLTNAASSATSSATDLLLENSYAGSEWTMEIDADETQPLVVSMVWTDPAGPLSGFGLDDANQFWSTTWICGLRGRTVLIIRGPSTRQVLVPRPSRRPPTILTTRNKSTFLPQSRELIHSTSAIQALHSAKTTRSWSVSAPMGTGSTRASH